MADTFIANSQALQRLIFSAFFILELGDGGGEPTYFALVSLQYAIIRFQTVTGTLSACTRHDRMKITTEFLIIKKVCQTFTCRG